MKRKFVGFWVLTLLASFIVPQLCHAITISAPQTAKVGQPVSVTVQSVLQTASPPTSGCLLVVTFGDDADSVSTTQCTVPLAVCGFTATHTYQKPGTYTIRASGGGACPTGSGAFANDPAVKTITVVDLNIQREDIYFNNRTPKITVKQYQRDLKAFADIRYTGSGLLQGQWEIDGRLFSKVRKQLYRGQQKVTLQTPLAPPLPTHAVGSHQVRFVITRPAGALETPQAIYFVEADPESFKPTLHLATPSDRQTILCGPTTFRWEVLSKAYVYLVTFTEEGGSDPIFSAFAKKSEYTLRDDVCRSLFSAGHAYRWQVKALSQEGLIIGQSEVFSLFLEK